MKHENWWMMFAAASASMVIIGGAASAALAEPATPITVLGERQSDDVRTVRVSYADLNLAAPRDERVLLSRVGSAARNVCHSGTMGSFTDLGFAPCVSGAAYGARPQIALAVRRAQEIATTGTSSIPLIAIAIVAR